MHNIITPEHKLPKKNEKTNIPSCLGDANKQKETAKEYILVIEGTAPAIVLQRCDSPNLSLPVLSDGQVVDYTADRVGRGWVSHIFVRRWPVLSLLSLIYILWCTARLRVCCLPQELRYILLYIMYNQTCFRSVYCIVALRSFSPNITTASCTCVEGILYPCRILLL